MWLVWALCLCVVVLFIAQVYFAYFKLDEILECLGESKVVSFRRLFIGRDFISRAFFVTTIAGMLVFSEIHIKDGGFTREEFEGVPSRLKIQLRLLVLFSFFIVGVAIVLLGVGRYAGWVK